MIFSTASNIVNKYCTQHDQLADIGIQGYPKRIEYILEGNLLEKSVKRPFSCTVSILQVYFTYLC